mmetsp:Transcript_39639/g.112174  ORF Transcript_39639/g.112174 Transcript_39639/m.112174 type:complete len:275 (-) Transcript_39639:212-1036(-)
MFSNSCWLHSPPNMAWKRHTLSSHSSVRPTKAKPSSRVRIASPTFEGWVGGPKGEHDASVSIRTWQPRMARANSGRLRLLLLALCLLSNHADMVRCSGCRNIPMKCPRDRGQELHEFRRYVSLWWPQRRLRPRHRSAMDPMKGTSLSLNSLNAVMTLLPGRSLQAWVRATLPSDVPVFGMCSHASRLAFRKRGAALPAAGPAGRGVTPPGVPALPAPDPCGRAAATPGVPAGLWPPGLPTTSAAGRAGSAPPPRSGPCVCCSIAPCSRTTACGP